MNELRRMAYLDALGIDSYVSRIQLPGAAVTRRLAIVSERSRAVPVLSGISPNVPATPVPPRRPDVQASTGSVPVVRSDREVDSLPSTRDPVQRGDSVPRFSLLAIVAGDWLWLEELPDTLLATEQVRLVQAMAQALLLSQGQRVEAATKPDVAQFNWPIHTNHQLDLGVEAARASVAGFVGRRLEQYGCRGLVLLGDSCVKRVPLPEMKIPSVSTASTVEILASPALKRQVWRDLQLLLSTS
jgi:hypothetical protein